MITFEAGEVRQLEYSVSAQTKFDTIIITEAKWELLDKNDKVVEEGSCTINLDRLTLLVPFAKSGQYTLKTTAVIPPERIIETLNIKVV